MTIDTTGVGGGKTPTTECGSKTLILLNETPDTIKCACYVCGKRVTLVKNRYSKLDVNTLLERLHALKEKV